MNRYKVIWVEFHEQELVLENDYDILMKADVNDEAKTYKLCRLEDIQDLGPEPEDDMSAAHSKREE